MGCNLCPALTRVIVSYLGLVKADQVRNLQMIQAYAIPKHSERVSGSLRQPTPSLPQ